MELGLVGTFPTWWFAEEIVSEGWIMDGYFSLWVDR